MFCAVVVSGVGNTGPLSIVELFPGVGIAAAAASLVDDSTVGNSGVSDVFANVSVEVVVLQFLKVLLILFLGIT